MAILNFPDNPQTDDQYTGDNGTTYIFDGVKWVGRAAGGAAGTNSLQNGSFTVQVDIEGDLVLPIGSVIKDANGDPVGGGSGDRLTNGLNEAVLNSDGSITFPILSTINWEDGTLTGPTLQMGNDPTVNETVITGPTPTNTYFDASRVIIQGQQGFGGENNNKGEGGDVYIWAGSGGDGGSLAPRGDGGDVKLRGGFGGNDGGYIRLESGDAQAENGTGGFLDLNAGNSFNTGGQGGNVNIRAGEGNQADGQVSITGRQTGITTDGGTWNFDSNGSLSSPNGYTLNRGQQVYFAAGDPPTVVYTSQDGTVGAIKAMIKVTVSQASDINNDYDVDTQVCEILVTVKRRYINGVSEPISTPVASVYGVTHTSTLPLATFTVNFIANMSVGPGMTRDVVQILAEPTAAATGNIWVTVAATEMTND